MKPGAKKVMKAAKTNRPDKFLFSINAAATSPENFRSLLEKTTAFELACIAAPFNAAKLDTTEAFTHAKRLLVLAEARLREWRQSKTDTFTLAETREGISQLFGWKGDRSLRKYLSEQITTDFDSLWKRARKDENERVFKGSDLRAVYEKVARLRQERQVKAQIERLRRKAEAEKAKKAAAAVKAQAGKKKPIEDGRQKVSSDK